MGVLPGVAGASASALNNTLLSVTCSLAEGVVVPIPTFCAAALPQNKSMAAKKEKTLFISYYLCG
jgi:hypothetical protein